MMRQPHNTSYCTAVLQLQPNVPSSPWCSVHCAGTVRDVYRAPCRILGYSRVVRALRVRRRSFLLVRLELDFTFTSLRIYRIVTAGYCVR